MDVITERANKFAKQKFRSTIQNHKGVFDEIIEQTDVFISPLDKIKYINIVIKAINDAYEKHKAECISKTCNQEYEHSNLIFFLTQELNQLGVKFEDDTFSEEEKSTAESKLDQILKDIEYLKTAQEVIYEDFTKEINELKDLYFLGKKKWYQLLIGKSVEMTAGGLVSETVSKSILEGLKNSWPQIKALIENRL